MPRKPFQVLLICCAVLGVYYSAMFAEISILDDLEMVNGLLPLPPVLHHLHH